MACQVKRGSTCEKRRGLHISSGEGSCAVSVRKGVVTRIDRERISLGSSCSFELFYNLQSSGNFNG